MKAGDGGAESRELRGEGGREERRAESLEHRARRLVLGLVGRRSASLGFC